MPAVNGSGQVKAASLLPLTGKEVRGMDPLTENKKGGAL